MTISMSLQAAKALRQRMSKVTLMECMADLGKGSGIFFCAGFYWKEADNAIECRIKL